MRDRTVSVELTLGELGALRDRLFYGGVVGERGAEGLSGAKAKIRRALEWDEYVREDVGDDS